MNKLIAICLLAMTMAFPFQVVLHYEGEKLLMDYVRPFTTGTWMEPLAIPVTGIASHMVYDYFFQEGNLGDYQVLRGGLKLATLLMLEDKDKQEECLWMAVYSLVPDLIDKGFGTNIFHKLNNGKPIFTATRDQEELLEDWIVFDFVGKKFIARKVPRDAIFVGEVRF